jgi:hypothetical protein
MCSNSVNDELYWVTAAINMLNSGKTERIYFLSGPNKAKMLTMVMMTVIYIYMIYNI